MHVRLFAAALVLAVVSTAGCARLGAAAARPTNQKAKKDCAACARMCEIAGESKDGSPDAVSACKQDCAATCEK
jgi:hypothetical protein